MPTQTYYHFEVRFARTALMNEEALRMLISKHGFSIANFSYRLDAEGRIRRHSMVLRTIDKTSASRLAETLEATELVIEFRIAPTGD
jgi:putative Mg2+ transporter-C (MgtC) family protein